MAGQPSSRNQLQQRAHTWAPRHMVVLVASILLVLLVLWLLAGTIKYHECPLPKSQQKHQFATIVPDQIPKNKTQVQENISSKATAMSQKVKQTTSLSDYIPKRVWTYRTDPVEPAKSQQLKSYNQKFLIESGFELTAINDTNYKDYLSRLTSLQLTKDLETFRKFVQSQVQGKNYAKMILDRVKVMEGRIRTLYVLETNGGVMMDQSLTLTEDLSWIDDIDSNPYVNRLNRSYPTSVVGFLEHRTSSQRVKYPTDEPVNTPWKYIRESPSISPTLIVARKNAEYITRLCLYFSQFLNEQKSQRILLRDLSQDYYTPLFRGQLQFLRLSRSMMDSLQSERQATDETLIVDSLGVSLINSFYGPEKLKIQLVQYHEPNLFKFEADISFKQLQEIFGPFRYAVYLRNSKQMQEVVSNSNQVMKGSLLHHAHPGLSSSCLYSDPEVNFTNSSAPEWESLPKIVWTVWLTGYESSYPICKLAFAIMKHRFESQGYEVNLVTKQNIRQFLGNETVTQLERITNNKKYPRFVPTLSDLFRLALLVEHGGVYMDMSTLFLSDVDWIRNIARIPSNLFLNRFSKLPKVLYSFSFYNMNQPAFWSINPQTHTKQSLIQNYQNFFIVAEKGNQYISLVFSRYKQMLETSTEQVHKYIDSYVPSSSKQVSGGNFYLLQMQMMTTVLHEKQKELDESNSTKWINAAHYFGIWSLYTPFGPAKYWQLYNHLDDWGSQPSTYFHSYSNDYVYGLIGRPRIPFVKVLGRQVISFNSVLNTLSGDNEVVSDGFHPKSFLRTLMDEFRLQIVKKQGQIQVIEPQT